jgi:hypothetical protein
VSGALSGEQIQISTLPITTAAQAHKLFCPLPQDYTAKFHGFPARPKTVFGPPSPQAGYSLGFTTGNADFGIGVTFQSQSDALLAPTSTPLPATLFAIEQADANGILASLQPSDTKPLVC